MSRYLVRASIASIILIVAVCSAALLGAPAALVVAFAVVAAATAAVSALAALAVLKTSRSTAAAAETVRSGDFTARVESGRFGESGLAASFNSMARALQETFEAAAQERGRLIAALDSSIDAIVAVGRDSRITFANDAARRLLPRDGRELVGNPFAWFVPDERIVEALRASRDERRSLSVVIERPDKRYLQADSTPILGGGDWTALVVFHDLTEVKRVEQVRRDFVANVSHELRTPLAGLKAVIETLESGAKNDPEAAADFLSRADSEVDRLVQMVEELLELSRLESGDITLARHPLDWPAILRDAADRLTRQAERASITLTLDIDDHLPPSSGDTEMLERALINLIHNAIKFTPAGGSVRVRAASVGAGIEISVSDTGVGILPEDLPRIFERFYKADRSRGGGGTGLGLAVARHAVEAHRGSISARSTPGEGSVFVFTIPAETA